MESTQILTKFPKKQIQKIQNFEQSWIKIKT